MPNRTSAAPNAGAALHALAEGRLRDVSVRVTPARVRVLAKLLGAHAACSHLDLQVSLADMDRVTLYRALDCLIGAKLAHRIAGDDRVFRYGAGDEQTADAGRASERHRHGHFQCTRCARVFCLDRDDESAARSGVRVRSSLERQLQHVLTQTLGDGFQSHDVDLTIKGWCADCARRP